MKESKYIILVFILFNGLLCYSQDCYIVSTEINLKNNFSEVWLNETYQGTIGVSNKRIQIRLLTITKNGRSSKEYLVKGKSKVGSNICDFSGVIEVDTIKTVDHLNPICEGPDNPFGKIICSYEFQEDSTQKHIGRFSGKLISWFTDPNKGISKTNGWTTRNGNSLFLGGWTEYGKSVGKYCSWASQIAPSFDDDLFKHYDNEFYIFNPKYLDNGWKSYVLSNLNSFITVPKVFETNEPRYSVDFYDYTNDEIEKNKTIERSEWWR